MPETAQQSAEKSLTASRFSYIAGIGMITSIGFNSEMSAASVKAGISGYQASSNLFNSENNAYTISPVPEEIFSSFHVEVEDDNNYSAQYDHIIKMAIFAIEEALDGISFKQSIPLILAVPDEYESAHYVPFEMLMDRLLKHEKFSFKAELIRFVSTGRAGSLQALEIADEYLYEQNMEYVIFGGSDSYVCGTRLKALDKTKRVLAKNRMNGFAGGEGAGFVLLTHNINKALIKNNSIMSLASVGSSHETGHINSKEPYRGEGLDKAFKEALKNYHGTGIDAVYSSMNGENFWAKEYGVAMLRNKRCFKESVSIEHPADCFGDLGVAIGSVLLGLSAITLSNSANHKTHLIYSSSDGLWRAAVRMEKIQLS